MTDTTRHGWMTPDQRAMTVEGGLSEDLCKHDVLPWDCTECLWQHAALADERIAELRETLDDMVEALRVLDYCHVNCKVMTGHEYRAQRFALARYDALGKKYA